VAIDSSGLIVVAGSTYNDTSTRATKVDFAVVRYTASGSLDTTFGSGGKVTTAIGPYSDEGNAVAIDGSGRIVVAGTTNSGTRAAFDVVRYTTSGGLDTTSGITGSVMTPFGGECDH